MKKALEQFHVALCCCCDVADYFCVGGEVGV